MSKALREALRGLRSNALRAHRRRDPELMIRIGLAESDANENDDSSRLGHGKAEDRVDNQTNAREDAYRRTVRKHDDDDED
jgi:hypothetical protein